MIVLRKGRKGDKVKNNDIVVLDVIGTYKKRFSTGIHTIRRYGPERSPTQKEHHAHKDAIDLLRIDTHWQDHCIFSAFIRVSGNGTRSLNMLEY